MNYEIVSEWEIDGNFHDMHFEESHFGAAMERYLKWVQIVSSTIAMAQNKASASVIVSQGESVFFKFSMQVE